MEQDYTRHSCHDRIIERSSVELELPELSGWIYSSYALQKSKFQICNEHVYITLLLVMSLLC